MSGLDMAARAVPAALRDDHALLVAAVREAGALALDFFRNGARSWDKRPDDPVSEADIAVDALLRRRLQGARPDYAWLSEEVADDGSRLGARKVWVVDPIDGTRAFLKGKPEFTICAALVEDGASVLGAVYNPACDEFFEAARDGGARLNGVAMAPSARKGLAGARLLASQRTFENRNWAELAPGAEYSSMSSIAYRMVTVGCGRFDAALSLAEKSDWDIAAADLIVREAGGCSTSTEGEPFVYNRQSLRHHSVLTAAPGLYRPLMALLSG